MGGSIPASVSPAAAGAASAPAAPAAATVTAEATVVRLPDRLPEVTRPVVLTGTVTGQTPEGLTSVRTAAGDLLLDSQADLPPDKPVTVQITPGATVPPSTPQGPAATARPTALILLQALGGPAAGPAPAAAPLPGAPAGTAGLGSTPAVLLPAPPSAPAVAGLPPLLPGTIVPALVLASGSAGKPAAGAPLAGPAAAAAAATAAATATAMAAAPPADPAATSDGTKPGAPAGAAPAAQSALPPAGGGATFGVPIELGGDAAHPGADAPMAPSDAGPADEAALPPTAGRQPAEPPDLPRGATVALRILTVTLPPDQKAPGEAGAGGGGMGGRPAGGQESGGQAASMPSVPDASPDGPPNGPPSDLGEPADLPVLRATVAGSTPQGQPILATRQGMLALAVPASLPQGARVTAALTDLAQAMQGLAPAQPGPPGPLGERDWPAMRQLMAALAAADPALARSMQATMPQPNRKLTAALSFFLSALRGGDAQGWLGEDAAAALDKGGRRDLLDRLEKDFDGLRRDAAEPLPGDWRQYTIPLMDAGVPKPVRLHVHPLSEDEEGGEGKDRKKPGSRFVIDVDLSRFGPMQLDGLVRPNHFDLILRSHAALPPDLRVELIQIFADSIRAVGYTGGLSFQSGARSWVKLTRAGRAGLGVSA